MFELFAGFFIGVCFGLFVGGYLEREVISKSKITAMENHIAELDRILINKIENK